MVISVRVPHDVARLACLVLPSLRMKFQVKVAGKLNVAELSGWKRGKVNPAKFADWAGTRYAESDETPTVGKLLARYEKWGDVAEHDYVRLSLEGNALTIEGLLQDDSFNDMAGLVATLWRSASRFGGEGELVFTGEGVDLDDRIVVQKARSRFVPKHKAKVVKTTTPEEAQDKVWVHVMNESYKAARKAVGEYMAAGLPIVPIVGRTFLAAFEGAKPAEAAPIFDAVIAAIDHEIAHDDTREWRDFPLGYDDLVCTLVRLLSDLGQPERACRVFERWRGGGGSVYVNQYKHYLFALKAAHDVGAAKSALDAFDAIWKKARTKPRFNDTASFFVNAASVAAMIGDLARAKGYVKTARAEGATADQLADPDLRSLV